MVTEHALVPPGPTEPFTTGEDLLTWMGDQFDQFGDIFKALIYGTTVYVVRDPSLAEHVLRKNWQNYVKGQAIKRVAFLLGSGLMASEGALWKAQRRMIQPAFHRDVIERLSTLIVEVNNALLARWERAALLNEQVDVTTDVSRMILDIVLRSIFSSDYDEIAPYFDLVSSEPERNIEFAQGFRSLGRVILNVAARRRDETAKHGDLLDILMNARDRDTGRFMPDGQLANEVKTLIVAGHETTATTLNWTWYLLSQHPEVESRLTSELEHLEGDSFPACSDLPQFPYTRQVIEETLRLYPAGWLLTRRAIKDDSLGEYVVPAGTEIYIPVFFIQRHPALWTSPSQFDPDRFSPDNAQSRHSLAMLPFSAGPRNCIGEPLARLEMQIHVMMVAKRLRLCCSKETASPELDVGVNLRSKCNFFMSPTMRTSTNPC
ncbi:MAG TPA: cytochrome P450 [Gemmatimonadaceae bacterium]